MSATLTGRDTLVINGRVIHDFAHLDYAHITFEDKLLNMRISKDGNVLLAQNLNGQKARLVVRLGVGSYDDQYFGSLLQSWINDAATFPLMTGSFAKRIGDGMGNVKNVTYQLAAGSFEKIPEAKANSEGEEEQAVVVYEMLFVLQSRAIA